MNAENPKRKAIADAGLYILASVGLVSVLAVVAWGIVRVSDNTSSVAVSNFAAAVAEMTSRFFPADEDRLSALVFTMSGTEAMSGNPFTFSWNGSAGRSHTFSYTCADGFSFDIPGHTADASTIACGEPFTFINTANSITLIPRLDENLAAQDVTVTISDGVAEDTISIVVAANIDESTRSREENAAENTAVRTTPLVPRTETDIIGEGVQFTSDPNGKPDLFGYILAIGYIDDDTNQFVATSSIERRDTAAVRFEVQNIGTQSTGEWDFKAKLPTSPSHTYKPRTLQQSLNPGDRIEFTLSFDRIRRADTGTVVIEIDPDQNLDEFTRTNNQIEAIFTIED